MVPSTIPNRCKRWQLMPACVRLPYLALTYQSYHQLEDFAITYRSVGCRHVLFETASATKLAASESKQGPSGDQKSTAKLLVTNVKPKSAGFFSVRLCPKGVLSGICSVRDLTLTAQRWHHDFHGPESQAVPTCTQRRTPAGKQSNIP